MLFKKLVRTALKYKAQFISMIIMVVIGMGIFLGFNSEWYSLQRDTDAFMAETNYADYRIYNESSGFSSDDISTIKEKIDGVEAATRFFSVNVGIKGKDSSLALTVVEDYTVSTMHIVSGAEYDETSTNGLWISDKFADKNDIAIGDEITLTYSGKEISCKVVALAKSAEYMVCVADENQLMPDYTTFGFAYVSPEVLKNALGGYVYYPQINIKSDLDEDIIEEKINKALGKTTLLLSKEDHYSYAAAQSEVEEGKTMGNLVPIIFLAIGVLSMITTMHRICANEKTQIGTLKALGFKNKKISLHYTGYGFVIGVVGAVLGIALGFGISALVVNPVIMQGTYFDMPYWSLYMPWYCYVITVATVGFLTLISFLSVRKMLKGNAAETLRPYAPKAVKPLAVEKTKVWNKMSFGTRWNLRDLFRHKARLIMTLIGVLGCTVLLVGGMGMRDTMTGFLDLVGNDIYCYETRINFTESVTEEQVITTLETYEADCLSSTSGEADGETISLDIYNVTHDKIGFVDEDNKSVKLEDNGVYICIRLTDTYSVGDTISFSPYGGSEGESYELKVVGVIRSVITENITMTETYAKGIGLSYTYKAAFTDTAADEITAQSYISGTQTKSAVMDSYDTFMEIMDTMVIVLVIAAIVLGVVVLYNLGVMSYVERYKELATLKVVGFRDRDVGKLLIMQNLWLTVVGLILGIPAGVGVLQLLITMLASEYELKLTLGVLTFVVSALVTVGMSLVVGLFIARKNKRINMVEALKGAE